MPLSRSVHRSSRCARVVFLLLLGCFCCLGQSYAKTKRKHPGATPSPSPGEEMGLKNIPLTVGHEAKGLVLPNYDLNGHLLGRFEAESATRIDQDHVRFKDLKIQTYDEHEKPDMKIDMSDAVLDLNTRVIHSDERTHIKRADFQIAGNVMQFNTSTHEGTLKGKVHMTIYNQAEVAAKRK